MAVPVRLCSGQYTRIVTDVALAYGFFSEAGLELRPVNGSLYDICGCGELRLPDDESAAAAYYACGSYAQLLAGIVDAVTVGSVPHMLRDIVAGAPIRFASIVEDRIPLRLLVRRGLGIRDLAELDGATIVTMEPGTGAYLIAKYVSKRFAPRARLIYVRGGGEAVELFARGKADAAILKDREAARVLARGLAEATDLLQRIRVLFDGPAARLDWGSKHPEGPRALARAVASAIGTIREDVGGVVKALRALPQPLRAFYDQFSDEELRIYAWLIGTSMTESATGLEEAYKGLIDFLTTLRVLKSPGEAPSLESLLWPS